MILNWCVWIVQKFQKLAEALPWSKHVHSKLVCSITREIMNEHNPPMVLPNGAVYSEKAVQQVASKNHNIFTCPKTGMFFPIVLTRQLVEPGIHLQCW